MKNFKKFNPNEWITKVDSNNIACNVGDESSIRHIGDESSIRYIGDENSIHHIGDDYYTTDFTFDNFIHIICTIIGIIIDAIGIICMAFWMGYAFVNQIMEIDISSYTIILSNGIQISTFALWEFCGIVSIPIMLLGEAIRSIGDD